MTRVDELRRRFGGWPGGGTRHTGCEPISGPGTDGFSAEGELDGDIIRRIVRAHIPEVRSCYELGLGDDSKLEGKVVVDFTIDGEGQVEDSRSGAGTDLGHSKTEQCLLEAVENWRFPKPRGGSSVKVSYPFELSPD